MLFNKRNQEPETPKLQGEDFDMFPKMEGYRYAKDADAERDAEEPQEAAPPELTEFQKKIADLPDKLWKRYQILAGSLLGFLCSFSIGFLGRTKTFGDMSLIIAAVLALFVPNFFEKKAGRKIAALRAALIISILVFMGLYMLYGTVINPDYFKALDQVQ